MITPGTGGISGLTRLYDELISVFASSVETEMGFLLLVQWLDDHLKDPRVDASSIAQLGKGDPRAAYQYEKSFGALLHDSKEGGQNVRLHRYGIISLTYALWEEKYRKIIADECELTCKDEVKSDVFRDLNKYRQAILHAGGHLDSEPTKLSFFAKGDMVSFTKDQMQDLFAQLIEELNHIGDEYYCQNPGFTLAPIHRRYDCVGVLKG